MSDKLKIVGSANITVGDPIKACIIDTNLPYNWPHDPYGRHRPYGWPQPDDVPLDDIFKKYVPPEPVKVKETKFFHETKGDMYCFGILLPGYSLEEISVALDDSSSRTIRIEVNPSEKFVDDNGNAFFEPFKYNYKLKSNQEVQNVTYINGVLRVYLKTLPEKPQKSYQLKIETI